VRAPEDRVGRGARRGWRVRRDGQEEAVVITATVDVPANDLARVVDPLCKGTIGAQGIVEGGVGATIVEKAVDLTVIVVVADDLSCVVDTLRKGATRARCKGIVEGGVSAADRIVEEAVIAAGVSVKPDGLA